MATRKVGQKISKRVAVRNTEKASLASYSVLLAPRITEKSSLVSAESNTIVFEVDPRSDKTQIKEAVEKIYKVKVQSVRTSNLLGKVKRARTSTGRRSSVKKAYVSLAPGNTIDVVEGV